VQRYFLNTIKANLFVYDNQHIMFKMKVRSW